MRVIKGFFWGLAIFGFFAFLFHISTLLFLLSILFIFWGIRKLRLKVDK